MMTASKVNYREHADGVIHVRVICPKCNHGGGHPLHMNQPYCHICDDKTLMAPASNFSIECTWEEARDYVLEQAKKDSVIEVCVQVDMSKRDVLNIALSLEKNKPNRYHKINHWRDAIRITSKNKSFTKSEIDTYITTLEPHLGKIKVTLP